MSAVPTDEQQAQINARLHALEELVRDLTGRVERGEEFRARVAWAIHIKPLCQWIMAALAALAAVMVTINLMLQIAG